MKPENLNPLTRWLTDCFEIYPDFPKPGIKFIDISPVFMHPGAYKKVIEILYQNTGIDDVDAVLAVDARGFLFAGPLAQKLDVPMILARKAGKLPGEVITGTAEAEYSNDSYVIRKSSIQPGQKILIVDDVLATGNTVATLTKMVTEAGAEVVGSFFVVEIRELKGREKVVNPFSYAIL